MFHEIGVRLLFKLSLSIKINSGEITTMLTLTMLDVFGHLSFALIAVSYAVKDMLVLRAISVASGLIGLFYNYLLPMGPLWIPIIWISLFMVINGSRIIGLYSEQRSVSFSEDEKELYETTFREFSPVEFMKLMRLANWKEIPQNDFLANEGEVIESLKLLFNGEVIIEKDGKEIARARDGAMIGEMSFLQGGNATATVQASQPCRCVIWPKEDLKNLLKRNPTMDIAMKHVFSMDLTKKLLGQDDPAPVHI
tara:strand:- start:156 stop:911 length:756 start_codon:yes stop_codon:yes gene_type:complete